MSTSVLNVATILGQDQNDNTSIFWNLSREISQLITIWTLQLSNLVRPNQPWDKRVPFLLIVLPSTGSTAKILETKMCAFVCTEKGLFRARYCVQQLKLCDKKSSRLTSNCVTLIGECHDPKGISCAKLLLTSIVLWKCYAFEPQERSITHATKCDKGNTNFTTKHSQFHCFSFQDKMLLPYFTTYQQHFDYQVKEVAAKLRASEPERFVSLVDHLRSVSCTALDFQKADMMLKVLFLLTFKQWTTR